MAAARFAPLPTSYQPWQLFALAAQQIAKRVLHQQDSATYQRLAGVLAMLVMVLPVCVGFFLLRQLSEWPAMLDAIVLYFCLDIGVLGKQLQTVQQSLQKGQLSLARQQLQPWVLRDTSGLSEVGVVKAALDSLVLRYASHWLAVILVYCVLGATTTLALRVLFELHWQWNPKRKRFQWFGLWLRQTLVLLTLLPMLLFSLVLALQVGARQSLAYAKAADDRSWPLPQRLLLAAWAQTLQRQTGGPAIYDHDKLRRARIGPAQLPAVSDITVGLNAIASQQNALWLLGLISLLLHFG